MTFYRDTSAFQRKTIRSQLQKAKAGDVKAAAWVSNICRFRLGMNYRETAELAASVVGISAEDWEDLMYEADSRETKSRKKPKSS